MMPFEIDDLFQQTLAPDYDDDLPWEAVHKLREIGSREVLEKAVAWCESPEPLYRARGLDVLAQLGRSMERHENSFPAESLKAVLKTLEAESDEQVLGSGLHALSHIGDPTSIPTVASWADHPSCDVRFAAACALGTFPNDPISVDKLIALTNDADEDVRDWATFGLGVQGETDTPEIRSALMDRTSDSFENARMEALIGLGKRKDTRIVPILISVFCDGEALEGHAEAAELILGLERSDCQQWEASDYVEKLRALASSPQ